MDTKKLRQKILDLAIRGKLVPQDPNDEPASLLLKRIRVEEENGKIKRNKKPNTDASENVVPFKIPESWEWTTLGNIGIWQSGATPSRLNKDYYGGEIPWLKTGDLNDGFIYEIPETITQKALEETSVKLNPTGSVLIAMYGATIGKIGILTCPATTNQACCACIEFQGVNQMYLFYFLLSHKDEFIMIGGGGAQPNISKEKILDTLIPLPPIEEQKRIVTAIEQWFALIDILEKEKSDLQASIQQAKSKILDLAIHGQLVPQDPNDEPAIELLKRINPEFEGCEKVEVDDLPDGWAFCRLENIVDYEQPQAYIVQSTEYSSKYKTPVLTAGKSFIIGYTNEEEGICSRLPVIIFDDFTTESKYVDFPFKVKSSAMKILHVKEGVNIQYVCYFMSITRLIGDTHKRYWISEYSKITIPLPPYQEQLRIVAKIEELFSVLDSIKESLE